jgi:hypothetical protein
MHHVQVKLRLRTPILTKWVLNLLAVRLSIKLLYFFNISGTLRESQCNMFKSSWDCEHQSWQSESLIYSLWDFQLSCYISLISGTLRESQCNMFKSATLSSLHKAPISFFWTACGPNSIDVGFNGWLCIPSRVHPASLNFVLSLDFNLFKYEVFYRYI